MLRPFQEGEPWGTAHLDVVGPFRIKNTERYLITAVDSFGGWPEVKELNHCPTSADIISFLVSEIIARHGVPKKIVSDNGSILVSENIEDVLCRNWNYAGHYFQLSPTSK
jgi:hypothetical protein